MATFKDRHDREWTVSFDAPKIRTVRAACKGLDLAAPDFKAFAAMGADMCLMVDVLWVLCKDQAQKAGLSDIQFGESMVGDALKRAEDALVEAGADFFPSQQRELFLTIVKKDEAVRNLAMKAGLAKINDPTLEAKAVAALEAKMDEATEAWLTQWSSATSSPDSVESPPPV